MGKNKLKKTISLDSDLIEWVNSQIEVHRFSSLSHAVELALYELKQEQEGKK